MVYQIVKLKGFLRLVMIYMEKIDKTQEEQCTSEDHVKKYPWKCFKTDIIPETIPPDSCYAFIIREYAIKGNSDLDFHDQANWQHYWFRCCISEKCNFIFKSLQQEDVDRENDLEKICNSDSLLMKNKSNESKKAYLDNAIDFLLERYDWPGAFCLCRKYPSKININWVKLLFTRLFSAILLGFFLIAASDNISKFTIENQLYLFIYSLILIIASILYFSYECYNKIRGTLVNKGIKLRVFFVFLFGSSYSVFLSIVFTEVGLLVTGKYYMTQVIFFAMVALFIGILIQLLWEEKTVTEPLF